MKINRVSFHVTDYKGEFLSLVDLWQPTGTLDIRASDSNDSIVLLNGMQIAFGHNVTHVEVS